MFSDTPGVSLNMSGMVMTGKENVRKMFSSKTPFGVTEGPKPDDYLHITMPVTAVVDIGKDGKTATGRWYALMFLHNAGMGGGAVWGVGIYENEYVKENGKWRILALRFEDIILTPYEDGWAKTPKNRTKLWENPGAKMPLDVLEKLGAVQSKSPFGDQMQFHYKHPITGK